MYDTLHRDRSVNTGEPTDIVLPRATAAVFRVLVGADASFSIRQLARIAGVSAPRAVEIVNRASERGLIIVEQAGRSRMCRLNREHLAAGAVIELVTIRERMLRTIEDEIASWKIAPLHASLFGSAARGEGDTNSDLDLLLIRPTDEPEEDWEEQKYTSGVRLTAKIGNPVSWFDISMTELRKSMRASEPIIAQWKRDSICLSGPSLPDLLRQMRGKRK